MRGGPYLETGSHFSFLLASPYRRRESKRMVHRSFISNGLLCGSALALLPLISSGQRIVDFSDLSLATESFYNGADGAGSFSSENLSFNNHYNSQYGSWGGWAYSNVTDNVTTGWGNQYSAIAGGGLGSSGIYAVAYEDSFTPTIPRIFLPEGEPIAGVKVTNTTYAYHSMLNGEYPAKQFGGSSGTDPDFFRLTITGLDHSETITGSVDFYLADYRFENDALDYIVDDWAWVDLSGLGAGTRMLDFTLASSDNGIYGMNTPAYFALGEVAVVPEPGTFALFGGLAAGLIVCLRRKKTAEKRT